MNKVQPALIINANNFEPDNYALRLTAKAVILNEKKEILLFPKFLIGGGVDEGETIEDGLRRECMEEAGVSIDILKPLGVVIQYRDELKKKYEVYAFIVRKVGEFIPRTSIQDNEQDRLPTWRTFEDAIAYIENLIKEMEDSQEDGTKDAYQGRLYNAKTHLFFIKKAREILGL